MLLCALVSAFALNSFAQETATLDELKAMKAEKEAVKKGIDDEIAALEKRILEYPGWTMGTGILFGLNFGGLNDWYTNTINPNQRSQSFNIGLGAFANYNAAKYYWRNNLSVAWGRGSTVLLANNTNDPDDEVITQIGTLNLNSSGGYFIWKDKLAVSARADWKTIIFELSPGQVTASLGLSYVPMKDMEIWVHPLGYQLNYPSDNFTSTPGASFGGSYSGTLYRGIKWTSTLSGFYSYVDEEAADVAPLTAFAASDLFNWYWSNGFTLDNLWNGVGVGFNIDLTQNKQLARNAGFADAADYGNIQSQYNLGFTYSIAR